MIIGGCNKYWIKFKDFLILLKELIFIRQVLKIQEEYYIGTEKTTS